MDRIQSSANKTGSPGLGQSSNTQKTAAPKLVYNAALDTYSSSDAVSAARAQQLAKSFVGKIDAFLAPKKDG